MKRIWLKLGTGVALAVTAFVSFVNNVFANALNLSKLQPEVGGQQMGSWTEVIPNIITVVFVVAAALTFAYLIMGAIRWITSGGDKSKVEEARNRITAAVIGLLILAAVWALFQLVLSVAFGVTDSGVELPSLNKR